MTDTTASIDLQGSGSLKKYVEDLFESMGELNKVTTKQEKAFIDLNKVGKETGTFTSELVDSVKSLLEVSMDVAKKGKDSFSFLKNTGESTIQLNDALGDASSGLSGFGLSLLGVRKDVVQLNSVLDGPAGHFRDIADAQGAAAKAFVILDKTSKPIITGLKFLSDQADNLGNSLRNAEHIVAGFAQTTINVGAKSLEFFSNSFSNLAENLKNSGLFGRLLAGSFEGVSKTLDQSAESASEFAKTIKPENLKLVDDVGNKVAGTVDKIGKGLDRLAVGVKLADLAGDVIRLGQGTRDTASAIANNFGGAITTTVPPLLNFSQIMLQVVGKLQLAAGAAKLLGAITGNQLAGALGGLAGKLSMIGIYAASFTQLGSAAADAYLQAQGLNDTFDTMQRMGIDTSAAAIAFQFGIVGEKLLFSAEAAKEFGKSAVTAFSQLEDSAAFVTTLGAGANLQFGEFEAGVESISAAMTNLVNGPLANTITSTEATSALYNSLSAGIGVASDGTVNLAESQDFLTASLKLSSSTGADAAQTLELLAKTSTVYGLSTADAAKTASKLYRVVEEGITTFPQLTSGMGRALVTAKGLGVEMDQALGSITALTQVMGSEEALTGFSGLMASVAGQGEAAANELAELGIKFDANSIKSKGLIESLEELYEATGGNSAQIKRIIPDLQAYQTAMILMTSASDKAKESIKGMGLAGEESLDKVFDARQQSTIQQFSILMNGFNEVLVDFGRRALPMIQPGVDFLEMLLNILQNLPEPLKNVIGGVILAQTAISNIGGAVVSFGLSLGGIIASLIIFRSLFKLGSIGKEWGILKEINANGLDFVGTLLRLVGANEKFDAASFRVNNTLQAQKTLMHDFSKSKLIDFTGDINSTKDLNVALDDVQSKMRDTKETIKVLKKASGKEALIKLDKSENELKKLKDFEKKIKDFKKRVESNRVVLLDDLQSTIDTSLSSAELTIEQKTNTVKTKLDNYFKTFGETGKKYSDSIGSVIEDVLADESISKRDKVLKINETFEKLGANVSPEIRKNFNKVENEVIEAIQRIDGTFNGGIIGLGEKKLNQVFDLMGRDAEVALKKQINQAGVEIQSALLEVEKAVAPGIGKVGEALAPLEGIVKDATKAVPEKIKEVNDYFDALGKDAPGTIKGTLEQSRQSIIEGLTSMQTAAEVGVGEAAKKFGQLGDRIKNAIGDPKATIEEKVSQINLLFKDLGASAPVEVQESLSKLQSQIVSGLTGAQLLAENEVGKFAGTLESLAGTATESKVVENIRNLAGSADVELKKLAGTVADQSTKVETALLNMLPPATKDKVGKNIFILSREVRQGTERIAEHAESTSARVTNAFKRMGEGGGADRIKDSFSSITNLLSNFNPQLGQFASVARDAGDVVKDLGIQTGILSVFKGGLATATATETATEVASATAKTATIPVIVSTGGVSGMLAKIRAKLTAINFGLAKSEGAVAVSTAASGKAQLVAGKGTLFLIKAKALLKSTMAFLSKGFTAFTKSLVTAAKFLAPFAVYIAAAAGALWIVHKALQALIPAYANATDGNVKFANSVKESNSSIDASTAKIQKLTKTVDELGIARANAIESMGEEEKLALAEGTEQQIMDLTGATREEARKLKQAVLDEIVPDEKAFIQGWRAPAVSFLEFISGFAVNTVFTLGKIPNQLAAAFTGVMASLTERIPVVGSLFKNLSERWNNALFGMNKAQKEFNEENRGFWNRLRDNIQAGIAKPAREAALAGRQSMQELLLATNQVNDAYKKGGVAFVESQELMKKAALENRALSPSELQGILANEQKVNEETRKEIQATIELRQADLEKTKDPVARAEIESQIEALQQRNIELENGLKIQTEYIQNVNALLNLRDLNDAAQGEEQLVNRLNQIYDGLSDKAKETFLEMGDLALDAEGKIAGASGNLVNSSQRRAAIAFEGARAGFLETVENLNDPEAGINPDKFANDLFTVLEAVDAKVAEGVVDFEAGEAIKKQYREMVVELVDGEGNIQSGIAESFLRPNQYKALQEGSIEAVRTVTDRNIEIKKEEAREINALEAQNLITAKESAERIGELNGEVGQARIAAERKILQTTIDQYKEGSQQVIDQRRILEGVVLEVAVEGFNDRKKILDEELNELKQKKDIEIQILENAAEKSKGLDDLKSKALNMDREAMQAQQGLAKAIASFEESALQNKLKFTNDVVEKASLEFELAVKRQDVLKQEQEFEIQNLEIEEQLAKMGLEREKIELRIGVAKMQSQKATLEMQISQADQLNLTDQEKKLLDLQLESINNQIGLSGQQSAQLEAQGALQEDINGKRRETIRLQQESAQETSAADVELARLAQVNAEYEKQKEIIKLNAQEAEITGDERIQNLKDQETLLEGQTSIIQKQLDVIKQTEGISQSLFNMAKEGVFSAFRQRRLEREAAQEKLKNLESIQKIEKFNLEIQQQQRDLALVRKEIELDVAQAKAEASLAEAKAEQARVEADPRSTEEQRRAAQLGTRAQEVGLQGIGSQRRALGSERNLNDFTNQQERIQQQREFGVQRLEAESALANTQRGRSGRRRVGRQALDMARESASELETLIDNFNIGSGSGNVNPTASAFTALAPSRSGGSSSDMANAAQGLATSNSQSNLGQGQFPTSLSGKVEVILDVKGEAAKLDKDALQQAASDGLYRGLDQLFTYAIQRQR